MNRQRVKLSCVAFTLLVLLSAKTADAFITIIHRGGRAAHPENTIPAFLDSFSWGADWVECDLRSSGDGVLICFHDEDLTRVTDGVYTGLVDSYTFAELREMNVCDLHCDVYTPENPAIIPTFQEALIAVQGLGPLLLDIKLTADVAQARAELDAVGGVESDVIGWIRYDRVGEDFRRYFPASMALATVGPVWMVQDAEIAKWAALGYAGLLVNEFPFSLPDGSTLVDRIHAYDMLVGIWGANPDNFAELMSFGPDGLVNQNAQAMIEFELAHACIDDVDNDGDGDIDFREDVGCHWVLDLSETFDCSDGIDNDTSGFADEMDIDCDSPIDPSEEPACRDLVDNDGDGLIDWPEDPGCWGADARRESAQIPALNLAASLCMMVALVGVGGAALGGLSVGS